MRCTAIGVGIGHDLVSFRRGSIAL
jgi:hypothetical protein